MAKIICFVVAILSMTMFAIGEEKGKPTRDENSALTSKEQAALRAAIYKPKIVTAIPDNGPWANFDILVAPKEVMDLQGNKSQAALAVLLEIVKGGRPLDSSLAAGYAMCLTGDPLAGRAVNGIFQDK